MSNDSSGPEGSEPQHGGPEQPPQYGGQQQPPQHGGQQQPPQYGQQQPPQYGQQQPPQYGGQQQPPQYGQEQPPQYGQEQPPQYGQQQPPQYGQQQPPQYGQQQPPEYGGQQPPQYGAPQYGGQPGQYGGQPGQYAGAPQFAHGGRETSTYTIGDAFNYGWQKFVANIGPIILVAAMALVVLLITTVIAGSLIGFGSRTTTDAYGNTVVTSMSLGSSIGLLAIYAIGAIIALVLSVGIIRAALDITHGRPISVSTVFNFDNIVPAALTYILVGVLVFIGTLLCVIPGIIAGFFSQFALYFVVDKKLSPVDAIKASFKLINNNVGTMVVFYLASLLATFIGSLLCGVGLLVAYPVVIIASAYTFRRLQGETVAA